MRLTIFGGSGPTGHLLIEQALAAGHTVTAFARTPSKLPADGRVRTIAGTLDDIDSINDAVAGSDAVLSLLGVSTQRTDSLQLVRGYEHIIAAMRTHRVERLIATGTAIITDPDDGRNTRITTTISLLRLTQRHVYDAIARIGDLVRESGLQWTIVRLPFLTDGPKTETVKAGALGRRAALRLSRANVAAYMLAQLTDDGQIGRAPFVTDS